MQVHTSGESERLLRLLLDKEVTISTMAAILEVKESYLWKVQIGKIRLLDSQYRKLEQFFRMFEVESGTKTSNILL